MRKKDPAPSSILLNIRNPRSRNIPTSNSSMASLKAESPVTPHSTTSPTVITQPSLLSDPNRTSPVQEKSPQDITPSAAVNGHPPPPPPPLLNPRSCTTCRKRKVRCDKRHPCANCSKANVDCIFPGPGRAPRRSRKPPDTELLARLRRLEGVVQSLGKGLEDDGGSIEAVAEVEPPKQPPGEEEDEDVSLKSCGPRHDGGLFGLHTANRETQQSEKLVKEFGRLTVEGGRSRYVSNKFWVSLSEEVCDLELVFGFFLQHATLSNPNVERAATYLHFTINHLYPFGEDMCTTPLQSRMPERQIVAIQARHH